MTYTNTDIFETRRIRNGPSSSSWRWEEGHTIILLKWHKKDRKPESMDESTTPEKMMHLQTLPFQCLSLSLFVDWAGRFSLSSKRKCLQKKMMIKEERWTVRRNTVVQRRSPSSPPALLAVKGKTHGVIIIAIQVKIMRRSKEKERSRKTMTDIPWHLILSTFPSKIHSCLTKSRQESILILSDQKQPRESSLGKRRSLDEEEKTGKRQWQPLKTFLHLVLEGERTERRQETREDERHNQGSCDVFRWI